MKKIVELRFSSVVGLLVLVSALGSCRSDGVSRAIESRRTQLFGPSGSQSIMGDSDGMHAEGEEVPQIQEPAAEAADLEIYTRYGLSKNAGLRSAFERWRSAMERILQVSTLPDPRFTFGQYIESVETRTGPQENTFALSQTFPWFGKLETRGEVQRQEANKRWAEVLAKQLAVELEIRDAFYEYSYLFEAVRITEDNLVLLKRLEPIAQRKIQGGGSQDDLIRLQVEIGKIENDVETLKKFRRPLSARLRAAMNWRGDNPLPWPKSKSKADQSFSLPMLKDRILKSNPDLLALHEEAEKQALRIELADLDRYPDFTLGANYIATDTARSSGVSGSGDDPFIFTLSFNIPIQRAKYDAAENEARAARAAAIASIRQRENDLFSSLDLQSYKLDDAFRQVALYRDSLLPRARQALEVTEVAYRAGTASFTDLIDSQRVLLTFDKAYERARANYEQALAAIEALCGEKIR